MIILAQTIFWLGRIFTYALLGRAILSWFVGMRYNSGSVLPRIYDFLVRFTEPVVSPVRELISRYFRTGMLDFSIYATMILTQLVVRIVVTILLRLA